MEQTDRTESFYRDTIEDAGSEEYSLEDPLAFWHEEKKTLWKKIFGRSETPFFIMGAGLVVLVVIFFVIAPKGGNQDVLRQVDLLSERIQKAEEKLGNMEALLKGAAQAESRTAAVDKSLPKFDSADASASLKMDRMADELSLMQKDINALKSQKIAAREIPTASKNTGKAQSAPQAVYHEVQSGETLYRISRQYNISVDSLRRLNGLSEQAAIHPGQKLKVKASGN
jgi:LysM repeat protein